MQIWSLKVQQVIGLLWTVGVIKVRVGVVDGHLAAVAKVIQILAVLALPVRKPRLNC